MTSSRNYPAQSRRALRSSDEAAIGLIGGGRDQAAQLSAASAVLQRSVDRLANLSDVRLLVSEVLTSDHEHPCAPILRAGGVVLDTANNERLAQKLEVMPAEGFPHWKDIVDATDTFVAYGDCGVHPALPEIVHPDLPMFFTRAQLDAASGRPLASLLKIDAGAFIVAGPRGESQIAMRSPASASSPCHAAVVRDGVRIYPFPGANPPDVTLP